MLIQFNLLPFFTAPRRLTFTFSFRVITDQPDASWPSQRGLPESGSHGRLLLTEHAHPVWLLGYN